MAQYEKAPSTSVPSQQTALLASSPLGLGWLSGPRGLGGERTAVTHTEPGPGLPRCTSCSAHSQRWSPGNEATRPLPVHRRPWHGPATGVQGGRPHGPGSGVDARPARSGVWGGSVLCPVRSVGRLGAVSTPPGAGPAPLPGCAQSHAAAWTPDRVRLEPSEELGRQAHGDPGEVAAVSVGRRSRRPEGPCCPGKGRRAGKWTLLAVAADHGVDAPFKTPVSMPHANTSASACTPGRVASMGGGPGASWPRKHPPPPWPLRA